MHGVRRSRESREAREARRQREQEELNTYLSLQEDILSRKKDKDWSKDAFDLTTRMLNKNPEFYTVWNYRRLILLNNIFRNSSPHEKIDILANELVMTISALKVHPKVYWIWNHRRWCLENIPEGGDDDDMQGWRKTCWKRELYLVEQMLDADPRNFHAWDYRRYVLSSMPIQRPETAELAYTTKKIESDFSNFSAWHQRTKVLPRLWESGKLDKAQSLQQEFVLVQNAMWADPDDQSVWLYHRWLIGSGDDYDSLTREIKGIHELLEEQPDSKCMFSPILATLNLTNACVSGCMETLVHYKRLLIRSHTSRLGPEGTQILREECLGLLKQLEELDPLRRQRYRDLGALRRRHCQ
ncbi:rab-protein geranylgeranyltransferase [Vararia minispora EC-137]|uniref:Rab-protein geranylgeranyltransferase n=1 Tax=Vararia minispora EC-137 TaxID=1314806 RepID=A0ACB8QVE0_9AGAM|nr:rab-protein geranylgeranyltransferase [Vararia minispora EC-137]